MAINASFTYVVYGQHVVFTNTSTSDEPITYYLWSFGESYDDYRNDVDPTYDYKYANSYTVTLYVEDGSYNGSEISLPIETFKTINASFTYVVDGKTVTFTNTSASDYDISSFSWTFGDGESSNDVSPTHLYSYASPDAYYVTLVATDIYNNTHTVVIPIEIVDAINASFTYVVSGKTVTFTNTSTSTDPITQVSWEFGDGNWSNDLDPVHTYDNAASYVVYLLIQDDNNNLSEIYVIINTLDISFSAIPVSISDSMNIQFTDTSMINPPATSWSWDFGDGSTSTLQNPQHTYLLDGNYTVELITDVASTSKLLEIKDNKQPIIILTGGYTPSNNTGVIHRSTNSGTSWSKVYEYPSDAKITSIVFM
jgi:PKD repeat protein